MSPVKDFDIAIVGGGIAGLTLAIALNSRSIPVTLYEQAASFGEIGAGVSFSPNAVQAMKVCHQGIYEAFETVCTRNLWPSKEKVWFDYVDAYSDVTSDGVLATAFTISNSLGQNGLHRAHFLDEAVKLFPKQLVRFGKRLQNITEDGNGRLVMHFDDGTVAETDAIIGCDGIKSRVRQAIVGPDHPSARPVYTHKYAYRGLIPMEDACAAVGEERAQNACMYMGRDKHILTFPVNHGKTLNLVAFRTTSEDWPDAQRLTRSGELDELLQEFEDYGPAVIKLLKLLDPKLNVWAIFDLGYPAPTFYKGRICISGDAAHATSPHHGAGAGFCIEDSAMLAELLADEQVKSRHELEAVFATYDAERRSRAQWLVESSRWIGDCYELRAEGIGNDFTKIEAEIKERNGIIADINIEEMCARAKDELRKRLSGSCER
ncbi:FAD/NAD(P)-binding domain-containing protein [Trichoderma sp. SZMC 28015]